MKFFKKAFSYTAVFFLLFSTFPVSANEKTGKTSAPEIEYETHIQELGWLSGVKNGEVSGTVGKSLRMEALKVNLINAPENAYVRYKTHVQNYGWLPFVASGEVSGTTGELKRAEAVVLELVNMPGWILNYRVHVEHYGWLPWTTDGNIAGTAGQLKRAEAIQIKLVPNKTLSGYVQSKGWMDGNVNEVDSLNASVGTTGQSLGLEGITINLPTFPNAQIRYRAHVAHEGWQNWRTNGEIAGSPGSNHAIEALQIELVNLPGYTVEYRTHSKDIGWQPWVTEGQIAGTTGISLRTEKLEIRILQGQKPSASFELDRNSLNLGVGQAFSFGVNGLDRYRVRWSSSNPIVATIDATSGMILGKAHGSTRITATNTIDNTSVSYNVNVAPRIKPPLIAIDAGHGYNTAGKRTPIIPNGYPRAGTAILEHQFNRAVTNRLHLVLLNSGFDVVDVTSGSEAIDVPLATRSQTANSMMADAYISVHYNASGSATFDNITGIETFKHYRKNDEATNRFAGLMHGYRRQSTTFPQRDRGLKQDGTTGDVGFHVLRETRMPAVLMENGFMTNLNEAMLMLNANFIDEVVRLNAKAICEYFGYSYRPLATSFFSSLAEDEEFKMPSASELSKEEAQKLRQKIAEEETTN